MKNQNHGKYPPQIVVDALRLIGYLISKTMWFIRYEGLENIPDRSSGGFVISANHQTFIDPVWICLPIRRKLRFLAVEKAFEWRFIGPLIKYLGSIPVPLDSAGTVNAMRVALRSLREGAALTVFPEGAREFADGQMFPFKTGAVRIALKAGVPILPVTINGGHRIWPQKQKYPHLFRRVTIIYHTVICVEKYESLTLDENLDFWTAKLRETIESASDALD